MRAISRIQGLAAAGAAWICLLSVGYAFGQGAQFSVSGAYAPVNPVYAAGAAELYPTPDPQYAGAVPCEGQCDQGCPDLVCHLGRHLGGGQGRWNATFGAAILSRSPAHDFALSPGLDVKDLNPGWKAGPRATVSRQFDFGTVEGIYYGIDGWNVTKAVAPLTASYQTKLYNTELNLKHNLFGEVNFVNGFRWVNIMEATSITAVAPAPIVGTAEARTSNDMYGYQLGVDGTWFEVYRTRIGAFAKAGVYGTNIHQRTVVNLAPVTDHTSGRVSFLGEVGVTATLQLTGYLGVYAGYQATWIDGVALAPDVLTQTEPLNGSPFYHGGIAGVELIW